MVLIGLIQMVSRLPLFNPNVHIYLQNSHVIICIVLDYIGINVENY